MRSSHSLRRTSAVLLGLVAAAFVLPATVSADTVEATGGTGPYDAEYTTTWRLRDHTVYRPVDLPDDEPLPIVAWGNGACRADGTWFENILTEFASHGYLVIANGRPGGSGQTDAEMLTDADPNRLDHLHAPIAYFTGGPSDIAYENALNDWEDLPDGLPAFMGHLDVGHYGTFRDPNGGEYGRVGTAWLDWRLKGDAQAGAQFVGDDCGLCADPDWSTDQKNLS